MPEKMLLLVAYLSIIILTALDFSTPFNGIASPPKY